MNTGIPIATAATAVQLTAGDMIYLILSAALWFGDQMETSSSMVTLFGMPVSNYVLTLMILTVISSCMIKVGDW